jgi:hypothetical protein
VRHVYQGCTHREEDNGTASPQGSKPSGIVPERHEPLGRVIPLPARVAAHKAKAEFRKGVLTVALPKLHAEHEKHKLIKVHVEG